MTPKITLRNHGFKDGDIIRVSHQQRKPRFIPQWLFLLWRKIRPAPRYAVSNATIDTFDIVKR